MVAQEEVDMVEATGTRTGKLFIISTRIVMVVVLRQTTRHACRKSPSCCERMAHIQRDRHTVHRH
jgi:hypothetical protein